jgi:hypothetical protein
VTTSKHIYFAAPLFAQSDLFYNDYLVKKMRESMTNQRMLIVR